MNALSCTFPVEVNAQGLHATWRDNDMFMKGTTRSCCHAGLHDYDPAEHR
jgi:hypothetical protein